MRMRVLPLATLIVFLTAVSSDAQQVFEIPLPPTLIAPSVVGATVNLAWTPNSGGSAPTFYQLHAGSGPGLSNIAIVTVPAAPQVFTAVAPQEPITSASSR